MRSMGINSCLRLKHMFGTRMSRIWSPFRPERQTEMCSQAGSQTGSYHESTAFWVNVSWSGSLPVFTCHAFELLTMLQKPISGEGANALYNYEDSWFNAVTNNISIILSSLMPPASIFALYYVHSTIVRLSMILIFSMVLTGSLAIFTSAKRVEIFTAAAALASVQVVFVGTSGPPS